MTLAAAQNQAHSHSAYHLAMAPVVSGSSAAATAAMQMLGDLAHDMGLGKHREAHLTQHFAKESAVQFAVSGLAFANVDSGHKAPTAAPQVADNSVGTGR